MNFTTVSGKELTLKKISMDAVHSYIAKMPGAFDKKTDNTEDQAKLTHLTGVSNDLLNYVFGWGVVDDPTPEELKELLTIDSEIDVSLKRPLRATWLRKIVLESKEEASALMAAILTFSK